MSSLAERIIRAAEGEIGVGEEPPGSNRGDRVREYQAATYLPGTGWPWCAAFYCWVLQQAGMDALSARRIASPSVAMMCQTAREDELVCSPRPGAAVAWCGVHVELLHTHLGGDVWRCIGGNSGDTVRYTTRSVAGTVVFGPPALEDLGAPAVELAYWLEDLRAEYVVHGPWRERAWAETEWRKLKPETRRRARVVVTGAGWFALRIGDPRHYGPWIGARGKTMRDGPEGHPEQGARAKLEARLGRRLRPYRTERLPRAAVEAAEALGKTT